MSLPVRALDDAEFARCVIRCADLAAYEDALNVQARQFGLDGLPSLRLKSQHQQQHQRQRLSPRPQSHFPPHSQPPSASTTSFPLASPPLSSDGTISPSLSSSRISITSDPESDRRRHSSRHEHAREEHSHHHHHQHSLARSPLLRGLSRLRLKRRHSPARSVPEGLIAPPVRTAPRSVSPGSIQRLAGDYPTPIDGASPATVESPSWDMHMSDPVPDAVDPSYSPEQLQLDLALASELSEYRLLRREQRRQRHGFRQWEARLQDEYADEVRRLYRLCETRLEELESTHAAATARVEDKHVLDESDLRARHAQEQLNTCTALRHMEAYCRGSDRPVTPSDLDRLAQMRRFAEQLPLRHQGGINVLRGEQQRRLALREGRYEAEQRAVVEERDAEVQRTKERRDERVEGGKVRLLEYWTLQTDVLLCRHGLECRLPVPDVDDEDEEDVHDDDDEMDDNGHPTPDSEIYKHDSGREDGGRDKEDHHQVAYGTAL